ncbi:Microcystin dependent protein [Caenispirillum salinarum AK4]|uniref:Microcystin dependent protein n=1 Tax=Caenispirillum salinarum AK4 TaxID=1238182 RepID=K9GT59_9PROT|nr:tail fiber protein [Caenispirillum salinarum]EKV29135.1 Microcystin dependent protein [Caenispirillum salinarum AK4]
MSYAYIGEIRLLPYGFAPYNWMACEGQLLSIQQYTALYSIIGITYGGNGTTNFQLPEMRGHVAMGTGVGPGLTPRSIGQDVGFENVALGSSQVPPHTHAMTASTTAADVKSPTGNVFAEGGNLYINAPATGKVAMGAQMISSVGGDGSTGYANAHPNMAPYLPVQFCICVDGIYPSRS